MKNSYLRDAIGICGGLLLAAAIFGFTRLISLTNIPIFTDEAIYLRWAQIALGDPRWRFISLIDGKQPMFIWLLLPAVKYIQDPLIAGRIVSVAAGFVSATLLSLFIGFKTKSWRGALIGFGLYTLLPFFLVYDRLAIYESVFLVIAIAAVSLSYVFGKTLRFDIALLLGTVIGFGMLTKSYATFFLLLFPATLLLVDWQKQKRQILLKWIALWGVVFIQSKIYENILLLSEFRYIIGQKNLSFIYSFSEITQDPLRSVWGNLQGLLSWLLSYITHPFAVLVLFSVVWFIIYKKREAIFFSLWLLVPLFTLAIFGKIIYPRFLLFMLPAIIIMTSEFSLFLFNKFKDIKLRLLFIVIIISPFLYFDYKLLADPIHAPLPYADRQQLINDWPAGYGIKEVVAYVENASRNQPVVIGTEGTFGLFPMALELYLGKNVNVTTKAYWPVNEVPAELLILAKSQPVFMVFKERQDIPKEWPLELIKEYQRGDGPTFLKFYRVLPS